MKIIIKKIVSLIILICILISLIFAIVETQDGGQNETLCVSLRNVLMRGAIERPWHLLYFSGRLPQWKKDVEAHFVSDRFLGDAVDHPQFPHSGARRAYWRTARLRRHLAVHFDPETGIMLLCYRAKPSEDDEARSVLLFLGDRIANDSKQPGPPDYRFEWHPRVISVLKK